MATRDLGKEFRSIDPGEARVLLFDGLDAVVPSFGEKLSGKAHRILTKLGVLVTDVSSFGLTTKAHDGTEQSYAARTVLWTAGVEAVPFARALATAAGAETDRAGRITVNPDPTIAGHPDIYVIGDLINLNHLPGVAEVAMQGGLHAAASIRRTLRHGKVVTQPGFRYHDLGSAAYLSRGHALLKAGPVQLSGRLGWVFWGLIHLTFLVGFRNRMSASVTWLYTIARAKRRERALTYGNPSTARQPYPAAVPNRTKEHSPVVLSRWPGGLAVVVTLVACALVTLDLTDAGLRRWWNGHNPDHRHGRRAARADDHGPRGQSGGPAPAEQ